MSDEREGLWSAYTRAWANIPPSERKTLLKDLLSEDFTFSNMTSVGRGSNDLALAMEDFQRRFPGGSFETIEFLRQHEQSLAFWIMRDCVGALVLSGVNYVRYDQAGKMLHIAGFWKSNGYPDRPKSNRLPRSLSPLDPATR